MINLLNPLSIPKYENQLFIPPVFKPTLEINTKTRETVHSYTVTATQFEQQILPAPFPKTTVYGYEGVVCDSGTGETAFCSSPSATFEAVQGIPVYIKWVNNLTKPHLFAVDPTLHWANPNDIIHPMPPFPPFPPGVYTAQSPVPIVTHLHGGEVRSDSDGSPDSWFTAGEAETGMTFSSTGTYIPNQQEPTTLWYHDHTLGITRLNVYAGLAGFYLLRDPNNPISTLLPSGKHEIPLVIQDRLFTEDGELFYPSVGTNPDIHPYWQSAFKGDTIMVNGRVWPNLNVERAQYRFRVLNGSNDRIYNLKFSNNQSFIQIGSDGGFLPFPVTMNEVLVGPAERMDILVDFSMLEPNTKIIMMNIATPLPSDEIPDPNTVGQIMQFTVLDTPDLPPVKLPRRLNNIPVFTPNAPKKILTLYVVREENNPVQLLLDGQTWSAPISELPIVSSTEEWEIVNLTNGAHPIHVHLIQFQVENRQKFDMEKYSDEWLRLNGEPPLDHKTITLSTTPYLIGEPLEPPMNEWGWKDTVLAPPGQVTRMLLRFAPQRANPKEVKPWANLFPFNPSYGTGYVWHCHILEHEDNEMMRPMLVVSHGIPNDDGSGAKNQ